MMTSQSGKRCSRFCEANVSKTRPGVNCYIQTWADAQAPEEALLFCGQPTIRELE
jgi:hypothetical protein